MTMIKLNPLDSETIQTLHQLTNTEMVAIVGGLDKPFLDPYVQYRTNQLSDPNTAMGQVGLALANARDAAQQAGDLQRANELNGIIWKQWQEYAVSNNYQVNQILVPG